MSPVEIPSLNGSLRPGGFCMCDARQPEGGVMSRLDYAVDPDVGEPLLNGQSSPYSPNLGCERRWKARPFTGA